MASFLKRFNSPDSAWESPENSKLPRYAWSYFDHIVSLYKAVATGNDPEAEAIITKGENRNGELTWGEIFRLESIVLSLQPPAVLQRNVWIVRERFREMSTPTVYKAYLASNPPTSVSSAADVALLRADLSRLIDVLHWYYALIPDRERLRKWMTTRCTLMITVYTCLLVLILLFCVYQGPVPSWSYDHGVHFVVRLGQVNTATGIAACVIYWGIIGGFVSSQRRMQNIPADGDPFISVLGLSSAEYYQWLSPLLGAVFAVILVWMFMGKVVTGAIFPEFIIPDPDKCGGMSFPYLFHGEVLKSAADYAKLFLWSFLAGFAERLVPDNLDRLANKLQVDDKSPTPAPPAPNPAFPAAQDGGADNANNVIPPLNQQVPPPPNDAQPPDAGVEPGNAQQNNPG